MNSTTMICKPGHSIGPFTADLFAECFTSGPALIRAKREAAFKVYESMPAPTGFSEDWRRTHPDLFPFETFSPLPLFAAQSQAQGGEGPQDDLYDAVVSISDAGYHIDDRSGLIAEGKLMIRGLAEAAEACPEEIERLLQSEALPVDTGKFEALNAAFWNLGLFIQVPDGVEIQRGVLIRHDYACECQALVYRMLVSVGKCAVLSLTEEFKSPNGHSFLVIADKEMHLAEGSRLKTVTVKGWGDETYLLGNDMARVGRDAQVDQINLNFGGKVAKMKFGSDLAGPNSAAELDGLFFTCGKQHVDQTTWQVHSSPDTYSRLLYKGVVKDDSQSVYQGIIKAKPGAIRVDAYQTNNNIVLNDGARAHTIPGLLIDADDLKCSHGATIGNLDEEQVFYLRARGIPDAEARRLVMLGFFEEVIERIPQEYVREEVHEWVRQRMPDSLQCLQEKVVE